MLGIPILENTKDTKFPFMLLIDMKFISKTLKIFCSLSEPLYRVTEDPLVMVCLGVKEGYSLGVAAENGSCLLSDPIDSFTDGSHFLHLSWIAEDLCLEFC